MPRHISVQIDRLVVSGLDLSRGRAERLRHGVERDLARALGGHGQESEDPAHTGDGVLVAQVVKQIMGAVERGI